MHDSCRNSCFGALRPRRLQGWHWASQRETSVVCHFWQARTRSASQKTARLNPWAGSESGRCMLKLLLMLEIIRVSHMDIMHGAKLGGKMECCFSHAHEKLKSHL